MLQSDRAYGMFTVTHAALGALIAEAMPNHPVAAFFLAFFAHFLTDLVPHGDTGLYKGYVSGSTVKKAVLYIGMDAVATVIFIAVLLRSFVTDHALTVALGTIGGILPDVLVGVYEATKISWLKPFHRLHFYFHNMISGKIGDFSLRTGFVFEVIVITVLSMKLL